MHLLDVLFLEALVVKYHVTMWTLKALMSMYTEPVLPKPRHIRELLATFLALLAYSLVHKSDMPLQIVLAFGRVVTVPDKAVPRSNVAAEKGLSFHGEWTAGLGKVVGVSGCQIVVICWSVGWQEWGG